MSGAWVSVRGAAWRMPWGGVGPAEDTETGTESEAETETETEAETETETETETEAEIETETETETESESGARALAPLGAAAPARGVARLLDEIARFGMACGEQVWHAAGQPRGERLGLFVGTGGLRASWSELWGGMQQQARGAEESWARGLGRMHPLWVLRFLPNNAHGLLAATIGARGEGVVCSGPLGGAEALVCAQAALLAEAIDDAIVVAYDATAAAEVALDRRRLGDARSGLSGAVALHLTRAEPTDVACVSIEVVASLPPPGAVIADDRAIDAGAAGVPLDLARASVGKLRQRGAATAPGDLELWYPGAMDGSARLRIRRGPP